MKQRYEIELSDGTILYVWACSPQDAQAMTIILDTCPVYISLDHVMQEN